jgi:hypothetical protein
MERTISTRTSHDSGALYNFSNELDQSISIDNGVVELDEEMSLNTEPSILLNNAAPQELECEDDPFVSPKKSTEFILKSPFSEKKTCDFLDEVNLEEDYQESMLDDFEKLKLHQQIEFEPNQDFLQEIQDSNDAQIPCPETPSSSHFLPESQLVNDIMSPGTFFSRKSGNLGHLGGSNKNERYLNCV